jgi:hypothetical protein
MAFEVGNVVRLNSGGPPMTVERVDGPLITCLWFWPLVHGDWMAEVPVAASDEFPRRVPHAGALVGSMKHAPLTGWLATQLANREASQFVRVCAWAGVAPGIREAAHWRRGEGAPPQEAWRRWPRSKTLPRQAETLAETPTRGDSDHPEPPGPGTIRNLLEAYTATGRMSLR